MKVSEKTKKKQKIEKCEVINLYFDDLIYVINENVLIENLLIRKQ